MSKYRQFYGDVIDPKRERGNPLSVKDIVSMLNSKDAEIEKAYLINSHLNIEIENLEERIKVLQGLHREGWLGFTPGSQVTAMEAIYGEDV